MTGRHPHHAPAGPSKNEITTCARQHDPRQAVIATVDLYNELHRCSCKVCDPTQAIDLPARSLRRRKLVAAP